MSDEPVHPRGRSRLDAAAPDEGDRFAARTLAGLAFFVCAAGVLLVAVLVWSDRRSATQASASGDVAAGMRGLGVFLLEALLLLSMGAGLGLAALAKRQAPDEPLAMTAFGFCLLALVAAFLLGPFVLEVLV